MFKDIKIHAHYYISLLVIIFLGLYFTVQTKGDIFRQTLIIITTGFSYIIWGLLHHLINHDLTVKIVIEYSLVGGLGTTILLFLLR